MISYMPSRGELQDRARTTAGTRFARNENTINWSQILLVIAPSVACICTRSTPNDKKPHENMAIAIDPSSSTPPRGPASQTLAKSKEMHKRTPSTKRILVRQPCAQMEQNQPPRRCCASVSGTQEIIYQCHCGANKVVKRRRRIRAEKISFFSAERTKYTFFVFLLFLAEFLTPITICAACATKRWPTDGTEEVGACGQWPGRVVAFSRSMGTRYKFRRPFKEEEEFNLLNGT